MKTVLFGLVFLLIIASFCSAQTIFPVPKYPYETCIVDYDLDGDNDIIVGCTGPNQDPDSLVIFINDGWGNFDSVKFGIPNQIALYCTDLTGDFYPDIITESIDNILFYKNDKSNGISNDENVIMNLDCHPNIGGITDINGDNKNDILYYCVFIPYGWGVQFNNGDNTFTDSAFVESSETWQGVTAGDLNNDNQPDILVATLNQSESIYILYNNYPNFEKIDIATPDWNPGYILSIENDTLNDVLLAKPSYISTTKIVNMLNKGDHFQACDTLVFENGTEIRNVSDYNLDGYDDLSMIVYQDDSIYIYFNDQQCGYIHSQGVFMGDYFWLATINSGDLNGDGYPDLVIQGYNMPTPDHIRILWNDGTGHFIDTNSVYVSQKEIILKSQISIFPNPASSSLFIKPTHPLTNKQNLEINIYSSLGKLVHNQKAKFSGESIRIDVNCFSPGIYMLELSGKDFRETGRFVKN